MEKSFRLHGFEVVPAENTVVGPDGRRILRPKSMALLLLLASRAGDFVDRNEALALFADAPGGASEALEAAVDELRASLADRDVTPIESDDDNNIRVASTVSSTDEYVFETEFGPIRVRPVEGRNTGEYILETKSGPVLLHPADDERHGELFSWAAELKKRRVFRAVAAYAVVAWLILQIVSVLIEAFPLPNWTLAASAVTLGIGFPVAAVFAWIFQLTPAGVIAHEHRGGEDIPIDRSRLIHHIDLFVIAVLVITVAVLTWLLIEPERTDTVTVAVMPFESLSNEGRDRYLGEGIADDIRARLDDVPNIRIAARSSSRALANQEEDVRSLGNLLGVEHILEGQLRRVGDRIRLNVQLVDVASGFNQWTKTYETTVDDVLDVQNKISLFVTSELHIFLTRQIRDALARNATDDTDALLLYFRARDFRDQPTTEENLEQATTYYREATVEDPRYWLAFAELCQTYLDRFQSSGDTRYVAEAEDSCNRALAIDDSRSEVHTAMGEFYLATGDLERAEESFRRAIELELDAVEAIAGLGDVHARRGDAVAADGLYQRAIRESAGNWSGLNKYAGFLFRQGRYEEALENYQSAVELAPNNPNGFNNLGVVHYVLGNFEAAAEQYRKSLNLDPGRAAYSNTGTMYYFAGKFGEAAAMFERAIEEADSDYRLWGNLADAQRFDGTEDQGRTSYQRAIELAGRQLEVNADDAETLTNVAWYYANLGDDEAAKTALDAALSLADDDPSEAYMTALVYIILEDLENARVALDEARSLGFPRAMLEATPELVNAGLLNN